MKFKNIFNLLKHKSGAVLIEFALIVPILVLILGSTVEISNVVYASQKVQTAAVVSSTLVTNMDILNPEEINGIAVLTTNMVKDFTTSTGNALSDYGLGIVIIQRSWSKNFRLYRQVYGNTTVLDFGFRDIVNTATGLAGGPVTEEFADLNLLDSNESTLINNYAFSGNQQIIIVKSCIQYRPTFGGNVFVPGGIRLCYQNPPTVPRVNKFRFLPNGSVIP